MLALTVLPSGLAYAPAPHISTVSAPRSSSPRTNVPLAYTPPVEDDLLFQLRSRLLPSQAEEEEEKVDSSSLRELLENSFLSPFQDSAEGATSTVDNSEEQGDQVLWPWQLALVAITACWGSNFAVTAWSLDMLGNDPADGALFVASRFVVGAAALLPFVASASSGGAVLAGAQVGALCAFGYATQAASLALGTQAGTAAFICSLQSVVVALMAARTAGGVSPQTWLAVALSVAGVGCLELPSVLMAPEVSEAATTAATTGASSLVGDLIAFGQPLGFGLSYAVLEKTMEDHPEDELPIAALQCVVIAAAAVGAASSAAGTVPWALPWEHMLPAADLGADATFGQMFGVPLAIAFQGLISTAFTIWLTAKVFKRLPSTDASIILASEPLWATAVAVALLGTTVDASSAVGGALILSALACSQGLLDGFIPERFLEVPAEDKDGRRQ